ncbi:MAG: hypothetical protein R3E77_09395 [Steroidobacteraceae bacterium]
MRKIAFVAVVAVAIYFFVVRDGDDGRSRVPYRVLPEAKLRSTAAIERFDIGVLFDAQKPLSDLAEPGVYTVVEIYSEHCSTCRWLEGQLPAFLDRRRDVVVRQVKTFSGQIGFSSSEEMSAWQDRQEDIHDFYRFYGTPHIEIYDSRQQPVVIDVERKKPGLAFLEAWLADANTAS